MLRDSRQARTTLDRKSVIRKLRVKVRKPSPSADGAVLPQAWEPDVSLGVDREHLVRRKSCPRHLSLRAGYSPMKRRWALTDMMIPKPASSDTAEVPP
jgi:hypothetical protein